MRYKKVKLCRPIIDDWDWHVDPWLLIWWHLYKNAIDQYFEQYEGENIKITPSLGSNGQN